MRYFVTVKGFMDPLIFGIKIEAENKKKAEKMAKEYVKSKDIKRIKIVGIKCLE